MSFCIIIIIMSSYNLWYCMVHFAFFLTKPFEFLQHSLNCSSQKCLMQKLQEKWTQVWISLQDSGLCPLKKLITTVATLFILYITGEVKCSCNCLNDNLNPGLSFEERCAIFHLGVGLQCSRQIGSFIKSKSTILAS